VTAGLLAILLSGVLAADPPEPELTSVVASNTAFATSLYAELSRKQGNLFFSPYSISVALSLASAGTRGVTEKELRSGLRFEPGVDVHRGFELLQQDLEPPPDAPWELAIATRLYPDRKFTVLPGFAALAKERYHAPVEPLDFAGDPEPSRRAINAWVAEQTHERITALLAQGSVTSRTRLVLVNAIAFKGAWDVPFPATATADAPFTLTGKKPVTVKMMHHGGMDAAFAQLPGLKVLALGYRGDAIEMFVLLPDAVDGLPALEAKLTPAALAGWLAALQPSPVEVALPRFTIGRTFELNGVLQRLGMRAAFDGRADFSGLTAERGLSVSEVVHQALVEVDEEGTTAVAATAVSLKLKGAAPMPRPRFIADHPFLFLLRARDGSILFMGRVEDPR
jgi:serpin B